MSDEIKVKATMKVSIQKMAVDFTQQTPTVLVQGILQPVMKKRGQEQEQTSGGIPLQTVIPLDDDIKAVLQRQAHREFIYETSMGLEGFETEEDLESVKDNRYHEAKSEEQSEEVVENIEIFEEKFLEYIRDRVNANQSLHNGFSSDTTGDINLTLLYQRFSELKKLLNVETKFDRENEENSNFDNGYSFQR